MGIIDKLKKDKKGKSVLHDLLKKKEPEQDASKGLQEKSDDIEVRELNPAEADKISETDELNTRGEEGTEKQVREFRTEGMHEFELESLGASSDASIKAEYKVRMNKLIDKGKVDEAITVLQELKQKLIEKHKGKA